MTIMARQRIGGNRAGDNRKETEVDRIIDSLRIRPKVSTGLFGDMDIPASRMKNEDVDYYNVATILRGKYTANEVTGITIDSIKVIANFYKVHYRNVFGVECIDYNWFHFLKVMEGVMTYFQFNDFIQLADFICKSFIRFNAVKKQLNLTEKQLSLSTYRQPWILDILDKESSQKFDGFY